MLSTVSGNIELVCDDKYDALRIDDLYTYLSDDEKKQVVSIPGGSYNLLDREKIIVQSKIAKLKRIHEEIFSEGKAMFDVIIIGAGVSGLSCANQLIMNKSYSSILIIDNELGGSVALTKRFGMGLLPNFIFETAPFLKSLERILTHYNVLVWKRTASRIKRDGEKIVVNCDNHSVITSNLVLANGCTCQLYRKLMKNNKVFDSVQLSWHKRYFDLVKGRKVAIIYKKCIIDMLDLSDQSVNIDIDNIRFEDIAFFDEKIYIRSSNTYVDYIVFDRSVFSVNKIEGEDIIPKALVCGDRTGDFGVLNAINTGIEAGKILIDLEENHDPVQR